MQYIKTITDYLESIAPLQLQEKYDNAGLIVGDSNELIEKVLICLDVTEHIIEEAIDSRCSMIISHHPIVFSALKKFTGKTFVERIIQKAIKNDIALYAIHTNLDNVYHNGVNQEICKRLGIINTHMLVPKRDVLMKLTAFVPLDHTQKVLSALYDAGAGQIGAYKNCSFRTTGTGTFMPTADAQPFIGEKNTQAEVTEERIEVIFPTHDERKIMSALKKAHPYEEVAYYLQTITNAYQDIGSGMIGEIAPTDASSFLKHVKTIMHVGCLKHTALHTGKISKIAVCGGSGRFLLNDAIAAGADIFITSDFKYHDYFEADGKIIVADIGHFESEQFTIQLLQQLLEKNFKDLFVLSTNISTNPVNFL